MPDYTFGLQIVSAPTAEPISVDEFKQHSRIDHNADDAIIAAYIAAAREYIEDVTSVQLVTATWRYALDRFYCQVIELPRSPVQSVTSITYTDENGDTQTLNPLLYQVDTIRTPGRIYPDNGEIWPVTDPFTLNAVQIVFIAGYGAASAVPQKAKQAVRLLAAHMYETREPISPTGMMAVPKTLDTFIRSLWTGIYR